MGYDDHENSEGKVSLWNEGNLKNIRLHTAQVLINFSRMSPLNKSPDGVSYNYEVWIKNIENLYSEGLGKYSDGEIKEVERMIKIIKSHLKYKPVFKKVKENSIGGSKHKLILNQDNWEEIEELAYLFEKTVKILHDLHGLSTRNYEDDAKGL